MSQRKFRLFFLLVFSLQLASMLAVNVDSLQVRLNEQLLEKDSEDSYNIAVAIGKHYEANNNLKNVLKYYEIALAEAGKKEDKMKEAAVIFDIGMLYNKLNEYNKSLDQFERLLTKEYKEIDNAFKASVYTNIAIACQAKGDYSSAFDNQLNGLRLLEGLKDSVGIARTQYDIGSTFFYQGNYQTALESYITSLKIAEAIDYPQLVFNCQAAIGSSYEHLRKYEESLRYNLEAMELASELNYRQGIAYAAHNIGSTYVLTKRYDKGRNYLEKAVKIQRELKDSWGLAISLRSMALLNLEANNPQEAITYLDRALELSKEINSTNRVLEIYRFYARAYRATGDFKKSTDYLERYVIEKDNAMNEMTLREMGQKKSNYELDKKEREIKLLKSEKQLLEKDQQIQDMYKYILLIAALFLLVLLAMFYSRYMAQKKSNKLLEDKNEQIRSQNEQLEFANLKQIDTNKLLEEKNDLLKQMNEKVKQQNEKLEDSNEDLKQFAYVASHDLKEPLRMIGSYTSLLKRRYSNMFDEDATEFMGYITDAVGRMEKLLTDLLTYSRLNTQQQPHEWVNSAEIAEIVLANLRLKIAELDVKVNIDMDVLPRIKGARTQLVQLFQNLVSNAIKFTKSDNPMIAIDCQLKNNEYVFAFSDNGIGISEEDQTKIFEMFRRLHSRQEYEGSGIGLSTCRKIVDKHRGNIWVESKIGEGSTFFVSIPAQIEGQGPGQPEHEMQRQRNESVYA